MIITQEVQFEFVPWVLQLPRQALPRSEAQDRKEESPLRRVAAIVGVVRKAPVQVQSVIDVENIWQPRETWWR